MYSTVLYSTVLYCTVAIQYSVSPLQTLIVAAGSDSDYQYLSSVELYEYQEGGDSAWRAAAHLLPRALGAARGATLEGVFLLSGGAYRDQDGDKQYSDEVYSYIPDSESWTLAGTMEGARDNHGVTVVNLTSVACTP